MNILQQLTVVPERNAAPAFDKVALLKYCWQQHEQNKFYRHI